MVRDETRARIVAKTERIGDRSRRSKAPLVAEALGPRPGERRMPGLGDRSGNRAHISHGEGSHTKSRAQRTQ